MKLQDLGEFQLIERIRQRATNRAGVCRGIGDDAAVLNLPEGHHLLTSTDMLIEGIHFRRDWTNGKDLGHKAVAVNLSDIAAMGGSPRFLYLGLACPGEAELDEITAFLEGALEEADRFDVTLVGGVCQTAIQFARYLRKEHKRYPNQLWRPQIMTLGSAPLRACFLLRKDQKRFTLP